MWTSIFNSPFVVAVAALAMVLGLGCFGIYSEIEQKRMRIQERLTMLSRGMSIDEIERVLDSTSGGDEPRADPLRNLGNARRTATVLISCGIGLVVFGLLLAVVLQVRAIYAVPASGLIPIAIGIGFLADYRMQLRELNRFGLDVGPGAAPPGTKI